MAERPTSIWGTTSGSPSRSPKNSKLDHHGKIYQASSRRNAAATTSDARVVIPHITNGSGRHPRRGFKDVDIALIEIGGTVGDIESRRSSKPFASSARTLAARTPLYPSHAGALHSGAAGELKTKPTHSVRAACVRLVSSPIFLIVAPIASSIRSGSGRSALYDVAGKAVITIKDVASIYNARWCSALRRSRRRIVLKNLHYRRQIEDGSMEQLVELSSMTDELTIHVSSGNASATKTPQSERGALSAASRPAEGQHQVVEARALGTERR